MSIGSCLALSVLILLVASPSAASAVTVQAMSAYDFENRTGINIHSAVSSRQFAALLKDVEFLRIRHLRDGIRPLQFGDSQEKLVMTSDAGIDWDVIIPSSPGPFLPWLVAHHADIGSVEGPNEPNLEGLNFDGRAGTQAAALLQHQIYQVVKSAPVFSGTEVLNYAMGYYGNPNRPVNVSQDFDAQNLHIYPGHGGPPADDALRTIRLARGWNAAPIIVSEIGYPTTRKDDDLGEPSAGGVGPRLQAIYDLDSLLDNASLGVTRTYLYDLIDDGSDSRGCDKKKHYGLFNLDGSPKAAALGVRNLLSILEDDSETAARFHPGSLSFSIDPAVFSLLIEKSNGLFYLSLWQEGALPIRNRMVGLTVKDLASFRVFDPVMGSTAVASVGIGRQCDVSVGIDPIIIEITPVQAGSQSP